LPTPKFLTIKRAVKRRKCCHKYARLFYARLTNIPYYPVLDSTLSCLLVHFNTCCTLSKRFFASNITYPPSPTLQNWSEKIESLFASPTTRPCLSLPAALNQSTLIHHFGTACAPFDRLPCPDQSGSTALVETWSRDGGSRQLASSGELITTKTHNDVSSIEYPAKPEFFLPVNLPLHSPAPSWNLRLSTLA
jgi:hypothetical protein